MQPKLSSKPIAEVDGIQILVHRQPSVTGRGKDRIWINLRQTDESKPWRMAATLAYPNAVDVRFERDLTTAEVLERAVSHPRKRAG